MSVHEPTAGENNPVSDVDDPLPVASDKPTPLPKLQLFIVILIQISKPIANMVIYPFINQFVRETGITQGDERKTGYYVGIIVCSIQYNTLLLYLHTFIPNLTLCRNLCFFLQKALRLCSGAIYRIDLGVGHSCFSVPLACHFQSSLSAHRLHTSLLSSRDSFKAYLMEVSVGTSYNFIIYLGGPYSYSFVKECRKV